MSTPPKRSTNLQGIKNISPSASVKANALYQLVFNNSSQANMVTIVSSGKTVLVNNAACLLLGYTNDELLAKNRPPVFDIQEPGFKKMLQERQETGSSNANVSIITKNGTSLPCEINSAIFTDEDGKEKAITTITDLRQTILRQKNIDSQKDKLVAGNIAIAKSKQLQKDKAKDKIIASDIALVKLNQKKIDTAKDKVVASDIALVKHNQEKIDTEKDKVVAHDIALVKLNQKKIDLAKDKIVASDIAFVKQNQEKIDTEKDKMVASDIASAKSEQIKIDIAKDKIVASDKAFAISNQKKIDLKKDKIVALNTKLALAKSDLKIAENSKWLQYVIKTSYDVMWDWNLSTGEIHTGDSLKQVFGYDIKNKVMDDVTFSHYLFPEEIGAVKKRLLKMLVPGHTTWDDSFMIRRADGSIASTTSKACIIRDENNRPLRLIGATQDVSRLKDLEKMLRDQTQTYKEQHDIFRVASGLSFDGIWDWDLLTNLFFLDEGFEKLFGHGKTVTFSSEKAIGNSWINYFHPDDKKEAVKSLNNAIASRSLHWEYNYRFMKADGTYARIFNRATIIRNITGKACRIVGVMKDTSKQHALEQRLNEEIKSKAKEIIDATAVARVTERKDIGQELHDNVNQLLGASRLYLSMSQKGGKNSEVFVNRSSEYTLNAIEEIRKLTRVLTTDVIKKFGLCESINNLSADIMEVNKMKISCSLESFVEDDAKDKFKLNVFRIIQEQVNNILKHAKATKVKISLIQSLTTIILSIKDNGIGFDMLKVSDGIGLENIKNRATSYGGTTAFLSKPSEGCVLNITFPMYAVQ